MVFIIMADDSNNIGKIGIIEKIYSERKQEIEKIMEENLCSERRWLNLIQEVEENKKNIQVCVLD